MRSLVLIALACSTSAAAPAKRWIAGDVHMHVTPPDDDVDLTVAGVAKASKAAGMEWVILTPHLWPAARGDRYHRIWRQLARDARATKDITLIPGIEWSTREGHFTVAGVDITSLGTDMLASAHGSGAFISVNHPFAVPLRIPGVAVSHYDLSYRAWSEPASKALPAPLRGVEVWNVPLGFANVIARPGGLTGEARAWLEADKLARTKKQRVAAVGGTDNHKQAVLATTWVLASDAGEASVLDALKTGATCVGSPDAGTLEARTTGAWVPIGGIVRGPRVELRWKGTAQLFVDGKDLGERSGTFTHATGGVPHTYRIVIGASRCGFVYANL
jgi:hypothetical protein